MQVLLSLLCFATQGARIRVSCSLRARACSAVIVAAGGPFVLRHTSFSSPDRTHFPDASIRMGQSSSAAAEVPFSEHVNDSTVKLFVFRFRRTKSGAVTTRLADAGSGTGFFLTYGRAGFDVSNSSLGAGEDGANEEEYTADLRVCPLILTNRHVLMQAKSGDEDDEEPQPHFAFIVRDTRAKQWKLVVFTLTRDHALHGDMPNYFGVGHSGATQDLIAVPFLHTCYTAREYSQQNMERWLSDEMFRLSEVQSILDAHLPPHADRIVHGISSWFDTHTLWCEMDPLPLLLSQIDRVSNLLIAGYPNGYVDHVANSPILQHAITSTHLTKQEFQGQPHFIADHSLQAGSSGSPVFLALHRPDSQLHRPRMQYVLVGVAFSAPLARLRADIQPAVGAAAAAAGGAGSAVVSVTQKLIRAELGKDLLPHLCRCVKLNREIITSLASQLIGFQAHYHRTQLQRMQAVADTHIAARDPSLYEDSTRPLRHSSRAYFASWIARWKGWHGDISNRCIRQYRERWDAAVDEESGDIDWEEMHLSALPSLEEVDVRHLATLDPHYAMNARTHSHYTAHAQHAAGPHPGTPYNPQRLAIKADEQQLRQFREQSIARELTSAVAARAPPPPLPAPSAAAMPAAARVRRDRSRSPARSRSRSRERDQQRATHKNK